MKKFIIITVVFGISVFLYLNMVFSTNNLVKYVEKVMSGSISSEETKGKAVDRYNNSEIYFNEKVDVSITRLFVIHDFSDGFMWVKYSYKTIKNEDDRGIKPACLDVISRWKIHKKDKEWVIVEIKEEP